MSGPAAPTLSCKISWTQWSDISTKTGQVARNAAGPMEQTRGCPTFTPKRASTPVVNAMRRPGDVADRLPESAFHRYRDGMARSTGDG
jgi:hypothetical protein